MKHFPTLTAFAFIVALATPAFAGADKAKDAAKQEPAAAAQTNGTAKDPATDYVGGPVADKPRNQMQCSEDGGTWDFQTNTCQDVGS
jgi:hypothetical protein